MDSPDLDTVLGWRGRTIVDRNGEKVGKFDEIFLDTRTDRPEWAAVKTGLLGRKSVLVPLAAATETGGNVQVAYDKADVEAAPDVARDGGELSQDEEANLYRHYGIDYTDEPSDTVLPRGGAGTQAGPQEGHDRPAPATDETARAEDRGAAGQSTASGEDAPPVEMTRSEEEVNVVGSERRPHERVRLKKYVVTDEVTKKVPVQREEIRVEREPAGERGEGDQEGTVRDRGSGDEPTAP